MEKDKWGNFDERKLIETGIDILDLWFEKNSMNYEIKRVIFSLYSYVISGFDPDHSSNNRLFHHY